MFTSLTPLYTMLSSLIPFTFTLLQTLSTLVALLIELSLLPQLWLLLPLSESRLNPLLLEPTLLSITLYALSEPLYYHLWHYLLINIPTPSFGVLISSAASGMILVPFASAAYESRDERSSVSRNSEAWKSGLNFLLWESAASQNAAWTLWSQTFAYFPEREVIGLHVVFGLMAIGVAGLAWQFCWWEFVGASVWKDGKEWWRSVREHGQRVGLCVVFLLVVRMGMRMMLGMEPVLMLPGKGREEVAREIWMRVREWRQ